MRHDPRSEETGAVAGTTPDRSPGMSDAASVYPAHVLALADLGQAVTPAHAVVRLITLAVRGHEPRFGPTGWKPDPETVVVVAMALQGLARLSDRRFFDEALRLAGQADPWLIAEALDWADLSAAAGSWSADGEGRPS